MTSSAGVIASFLMGFSFRQDGFPASVRYWSHSLDAVFEGATLWWRESCYLRIRKVCDRVILRGWIDGDQSVARFRKFLLYVEVGMGCSYPCGSFVPWHFSDSEPFWFFIDLACETMKKFIGLLIGDWRRGCAGVFRGRLGGICAQGYYASE